MRVLLVSANTLTEPYPVYPLGLDYVAGAIAADHQVQIADMNALTGYDALAEIIEQFLPHVVGLALRNIDNTDTTDPRGFIGHYREIVEFIRNHSNAILVLGGSGFTIFPAEAMEALDADYGIVGEGERLALLLDAIAKDEDTAAMPGIIARQADGVKPVPWQGDISRNFTGNPSHLRFYLQKGGMLNLQTKRGCAFQCVYCTYPHIEGRPQRLTDPEEVAGVAAKLQDAGAKYFFVTDAVFNSDVSHCIAVARAFKKAGISIPWGAFFAPFKPPEGFFEMMADAGLSHVEFGTESLSNQVLTSYRKPFRVDHVFKAHRAANEAGLHVAHYFLLGGPGENSATLNETLTNVGRLERAVFFFFCGMRIYPNTALYDIAVKEGQVEPGQSLLEPVFYRNTSLDGDEIIRRVRIQAQERVNWVIGAGGKESADIIARLYERGHCGPLWEYLIR
jgi:radical SAM superfamily enzyme YgiQ (UPF0313 family)